MRPLLASLVAALVALPAQPLYAQSWTVRPSLQLGLAATDNANHAAGAEARTGVVASAQPRVAIDGRSSASHLHAIVGADLVAHGHGARPNRAYPLLIADLAATLAPRWLFLDALASVQATERDPYGARSETGDTDKRATTSAYRLSPYIEHEFSPGAGVLARYEHAGSSSALTARGDLALADDLVVGPVIGRERSTLWLEKSADTLYGAHLVWTPNERTRVAAQAEHRFFGTGWQLEANYRRPWMSFALRWIRWPVTSSTSLGVVAADARLDSFLDAILTTRIPDAAQRKTVVADLVASRGLPIELQRPIDVQADYAQLQDSVRGTWVLTDLRNIVSLTAYRQTTRRLTWPGSRAAVVPLDLDNRQSGARLNLNRRLSPLLTFDASATWSRVRGFGATATDRSREQTWRASMVRALAPSTGLSIGLQSERFDTTRAGVGDHKAASAFVGLRHRF